MSFLSEFKENIYDPWSTEYVTYEAILKGLYEICDNGHWTTKDELDFESAIRLEAGKVDTFINRKQRELETRIGYRQRMLHQPPDASVEKAAKEILKSVRELSQYGRMNFKALENLIKEHDRLTHLNKHPLLIEISRTRSLDTQRFDTLLLKAASLLDQLNPSSSPQQQSVRARYWVHTDRVTEVKAILLFNLPIYSDNPFQDFEQSDQRQTRVYLDTDKFDHYASRLQYDDKDEYIQCYWTGDAGQIFVERKRLTKTNRGSDVQTDKITLNKDQMKDFLTGNYAPEDDSTQERHAGSSAGYTAARSMQQFILNKRLGAKLRVSYNHLSFKSPQNSTLLVSLDTEMAFVREDEGRKRAEAWYETDSEYPFKSLDKSDLYLFPHAVLEIQTTTTDNLPPWLSELLDLKLVYEIPRFSAYVHGVAHFWSQQLPLLPWWLSQIDLDDLVTGKREKRMIEGSCGSSVFPRSTEDRSCPKVGYLELQLGIKEDANQISVRPPSLGSSSSTGGIDMSREIRSDPQDSKKEVVLQVEDTTVVDSTSHLSLASTYRPSELRSRLGSKASSTNEQRRDSFLSFYNDGRNRQSEGYMLQDLNTVNQGDALRKAAVIEMGEEKEEEKKQKKKKKFKPLEHRLEPKLFFANERTFIHWLQFSALILTAALTLLNFGDYISTISGATFFGISLVIALYAFFRYRLRAYKMSTRPDVRYDDLYGPVGLCCLLLGAMVLNFVLRWEHPPSESTYLGVNSTTEQQPSTS
ncbi:MAG: VTC domain-containing protein [Benjaminiella poitrasii]|nr:MAG: VTC domain-containing protein [Benjaminiella poitrasii]